MMVTTPCIGCRTPVPVGTGGRCPACRLPHRRARSSAAWTQRSREVRASGACARCGATGVPLEAAHTTALTLGGQLLEDARPLCAACHQLETAAEAQERAIRERR